MRSMRTKRSSKTRVKIFTADLTPSYSGILDLVVFLEVDNVKHAL